MYWMKGCGKCGGDLYLERDKFGSYVSCIHCGAVRLDFGGTVAAGAATEMLTPVRQERRIG